MSNVCDIGQILMANERKDCGTAYQKNVAWGKNKLGKCAGAHMLKIHIGRSVRMPESIVSFFAIRKYFYY